MKFIINSRLLVMGTDSEFFLTLHSKLKEEHYEDVIDLCSERIAIQDTNVNYYNYKAKALLELKRFSEALEIINKASKLDPENKLAKNLKVLILHRTCNDLYSTGHYEEALKCYNQVIALEPHWHSPYLEKVTIFNSLGKFEESISTTDAILKIILKDPDIEKSEIATIYELFATLHYNADNYEASLKYYDKAITINSNKVSYYVDKAHILFFHLEHYDEAMVMANNVLRINPNNNDALSIRLCIEGMQQYNMENYEAAIAYYDQAIDVCNVGAETCIDKILKDILYSKMLTYAQLSDFEAVKDLYEQMGLGDDTQQNNDEMLGAQNVKHDEL